MSRKIVLPSMKSHNALITWSFKAVWNINPIISLLQQFRWSTNLARWLFTMRSFHPQSYTTVCICGCVKPRDKLILHYYFFTTTIPLVTKPGRIVTDNEELPSIKSGDHLIAWSCKVRWQVKNVISPHISYVTTMTMANKPGKLIPYSEELALIKLKNLLITCSYKVTWQIRYFLSILPQDLCPLNLAIWWVNVTDFYPARQIKGL